MLMQNLSATNSPSLLVSWAEKRQKKQNYFASFQCLN